MLTGNPQQEALTAVSCNNRIVAEMQRGLELMNSTLEMRLEHEPRVGTSKAGRAPRLPSVSAQDSDRENQDEGVVFFRKQFCQKHGMQVIQNIQDICMADSKLL